jgi:hypothetical protein
MTEDRDARIIELDKLEEMMRSGKVVKIEPMPKPAAPIQQAADISESEVAGDDRMKIADLIVALSNNVLSKDVSARHIALRIGSPPNCNTVTISKGVDRVSFYIQSTDLRKKAEAEGFKPEALELVALRNKDKYRFRGLSLSDIQAHEALFREIVKESLRVVMDKRPKKS